MKILDVCCGSRMFWYDKKEPHTTYMDIHKAFNEIMRVMKPTGVMIFKWNEEQIPIKEVLRAFGQQPILGDMRSKTKWSVFIKSEKVKDIPTTQDKSNHKVIEGWRKVIEGIKQ